MDLRTRYLGFELPHPLMPGASPMVDDLGLVLRLEDAGASAIVMHSLFEEQIAGEELMAMHHVAGHEGVHGEAASYLPDPPRFVLGPDDYLEQLARLRARVSVPVIASLNGTTRGGWLRYAKLIEEAGAQALELNVYEVATDPTESSAAVESRLLEVIRAVRSQVKIPICVKLSPFYSSFPSFAKSVVEMGAQGLVLFNRFFQPDLDVENLEVDRSLRLSTASELPLRLRWLAILYGRFPASLVASGGVHAPIDVVKAILSGADVIQVVSALLIRGPEYLAELRNGLEQWLVEHEYESLAQARGSLSLRSCPDPHAYERANYMHLLQGWRAGM